MKLVITILLLVVFAGFAHPAQADVISSFHSDISIDQNTSINISETLTHQTEILKHGIYRYIPSRSITHVIVSDENGNKIPYTTFRNGKNFVIKIGDPNVTYFGERTYHISYTIRDALTRFPDHDELYWDITGEGWQIPVLKSSAVITSPYAPITGSSCFSGKIGTNNQLCIIKHSNDQSQVIYDQVVDYNDNLTIALKLDKNNQLMFPGTIDKILNLIRENFLLFFIPLPMLFLFFIWVRYGRDYESVSGDIYNLDPNQPTRLRPILTPKRVPFVYEPLKTLTPAQAGAILDEKVDNRDIIADIINFARKKLITIERKEEKILFIKDVDYIFTRLVENPENLSEHEDLLFKRLFALGPVVTLSHLKGVFYTSMQEVGQKIDDELMLNNFYTIKPIYTRSFGILFSIALNTAVFFALKSFYPPLENWVFFILYAIQGIASLLLGANLTQKTVVGNNLMLQARGLQQTIKTGKWRQEIQEKHLFIEEVLPFAISLGVVEKLARDMEVLNIKPPHYISHWTVSSVNWSSMVSDFSASAASTLSFNPASSSSSGGSGFSSGSSGGGGGGGGGGSW